ncbi:MAG: serine/threonine-protein kinase [Candidatus Acidiferrum sp.]
MTTNDPPKDSGNSSLEPSSDPTQTTGARGGAGARHIGPYRLLQVLGEGGMGEVWLAEQTAPIQRTVALKLIKAGMDTKAVVARFESERQALALMDHPCIARVFDAGSTAEGRPYFVMEYVPGLPISEYCDKHLLTIRERLELFTQVCEGVQHAHQKAIIHRDLKPSNILVIEQDNKAVPKIIDFGLAKATAQRLTDHTMFTELGMMLGTPAYMSPEQADQREQNVDTRTDVYSLGVILYQLLVGALPFEPKALQAAGLEAVLRVIREQEPPKPSTKIRAMGEGSNISAHNRRTEPRSFARQLQGELDWITMKALEKDRVRRYGTASELAADISRYLRNEPVVAGPATAAYRLKKYAARHRVALGAAAVLLLLLAGFAVTQAVELRRITEERNQATRERDRATRITDFMTSMFRVSDPSEARGNSVTAREILDKASANIDTGLAKDPELQAQMMHVMGDVYDNLGLYSRAMPLVQKSVEIRKRVLGPENTDTLKSENNLAILLARSGHYPEAEKLARETLDTSRRVLGPENPLTLGSTSNLAILLDHEGRLAEAEQLDRQALDVSRRVLGPEHPNTLKSMSTLANVVWHEGKLADAEKLDRELLDIRRRVLGPDHPDTLNTMNNLASVLDDEGHYADAEKLYRETLDIQRRVLGPEHPVTLGSMSNLANALDNEGQYSEAEKLCRESLDIRRRVLGPEHPNTLESMGNLAATLTHEGQYDEAEKLDRDVLDIRQRTLGPDNRETAISRYALGTVAAARGQRDKAFSFLHEAVDHGLPGFALVGMEKDPDLKALHGDPRFDALVAQAKERAAGAQK